MAKPPNRGPTRHTLTEWGRTGAYGDGPQHLPIVPARTRGSIRFDSRTADRSGVSGPAPALSGGDGIRPRPTAGPTDILLGRRAVGVPDRSTPTFRRRTRHLDPERNHAVNTDIRQSRAGPDASAGGADAAGHPVRSALHPSLRIARSRPGPLTRPTVGGPASGQRGRSRSVWQGAGCSAPPAARRQPGAGGVEQQDVHEGHLVRPALRPAITRGPGTRTGNETVTSPGTSQRPRSATVPLTAWSSRR